MRVPRNRTAEKRLLELSLFRDELLAWYDRERRDLPWRTAFAESPEQRAWGIWLSEVMAQQTRIEVVVPYWRRFIERYPDPATLAAAPEEEVLGLWSGLGYYRRARQLRAAAREVAERGGIPSTAAELRQLAGFGPYTAAAVASIAFGEPVAVVDGNVERVISRVLEIEEDPRRAAGKRAIREGARALLDPERAGDSNQAMMELGARVCKPREPLCGDCALAPACGALRNGRVEELPPPRRRRETERIDRRLGVVARETGEVLLVRRGEERTVMAGFWELPGVEVDGPDEAVEKAERELGRRFGGRWSLGPAAARVRHAITHRSITLHVHRAELLDGGQVSEGIEATWWDPGDSGDPRPLGAATLKALAALDRSAQSSEGASRD